MVIYQNPVSKEKNLVQNGDIPTDPKYPVQQQPQRRPQQHTLLTLTIINNPIIYQSIRHNNNNNNNNKMADISQYKVGVVVDVEELKATGSGGKPLRLCQVKIGNDVNDDNNVIPVVTAASNVRKETRCVVAPVGSTILGEDGDSLIEVTKTTVGGRQSCGILCDSKMLGWAGGAEGVAVQVPPTFDIGSSPPSSKPGRPNDNNNSEATTADLGGPVTGGLFEKKLSKEEKKKLAAEKRAAKKAAKEAAAAATTTGK